MMDARRAELLQRMPAFGALGEAALQQLVELNRFGPGDCFGEMALMALRPPSASVRALTPCLAIEFGPEEMLRLQQADQQFTLLQMNLGREVSRRLRATDGLLFLRGDGGDASGCARRCEDGRAGPRRPRRARTKMPSSDLTGWLSR
ncbi:MAG: cyclic nucleotide-binding domain-containing protein [Rubrivivax sp.]|nr:cyclic nucleotide-binding domain-containing protein [Rubrivivax sp.]